MVYKELLSVNLNLISLSIMLHSIIANNELFILRNNRSIMTQEKPKSFVTNELQQRKEKYKRFETIIPYETLVNLVHPLIVDMRQNMVML